MERSFLDRKMWQLDDFDLIPDLPLLHFSCDDKTFIHKSIKKNRTNPFHDLQIQKEIKIIIEFLLIILISEAYNYFAGEIFTQFFVESNSKKYLGRYAIKNTKELIQLIKEESKINEKIKYSDILRTLNNPTNENKGKPYQIEFDRLVEVYQNNFKEITKNRTKKDDLKVLKTLIKLGADVNERDACDKLAIDYAFESGNYKKVGILFEKGSEISKNFIDNSMVFFFFLKNFLIFLNFFFISENV